MNNRRKHQMIRRMVISTCCCLVIMCGFLFSTPAPFMDDYLLDHWDTDSGLPSNVIHAITQTPDGYLWAATHNGLMRFDGISFQPVRFAGEWEKQSGETAVAQSLFLDKDQILWIGSSIGLTSYDFRTRQFYTYTPANSPGLNSGTIRRIYQDKAGNIWLGFVAHSLVRFSPTQKVFTPFGPSQGLTGNMINGIVETNQGQLVIGTRNNGLFVYRSDRFHLQTNVQIIDYLVSIHNDVTDRLWMCTSQGLFKIAGDSVKKITVQQGLYSNLTTFILFDGEKRMWIGTAKGLNHLTLEDDGRFSIDRLFPSSPIVCLFKDRENSLWVGTYDEGLKRLKPARFRTISPFKNRSQEMLFSMSHESNGDVLLGTTGGEVYRLNSSGQMKALNLPHLSGTGISGIYTDSTRSLWLATNGDGVYKYHKDTVLHVTKKEGLAHPLVTSIMEDSEGNIWFGTYGGVSIWNRKSGRLSSLHTSDGLSGEKVHTIHQDQDGNIWIACDGGLSFLKGGFPVDNTNTFAITSYLKGTPVTWIYEDTSPPPADGPVLWLATNGAGLKRFKVKKEQIYIYTAAHGLSTSFIYRFFQDAQGFFWCQSPQGLLRIDKSSLNRLASGEEKQLLCISFGKDDGILNPGFNNPFPRHTAFETPDNELWFLNNNEIVIAKPEKIRINTIEPPVVIEKFKVGNQSVPLPLGPDGKTFVDAQSIQIHFNATTLLSSERVIFRYRLFNVDSDWRYLSAGKPRLAEYNDLAEGTYLFKVSARNADGIWNSSGASLTFTFKPSFFKSSLFYYLFLPGLLIVFTSAVLLVVRRRKGLDGHVGSGTSAEQTEDETPLKQRQAKESSLHPDFVQTVISKLMHVIEVEKVFLDENLTLPSLAQKLSIHRYQLSQVLNEELNRSFPDFINYYRIEEAKKILEGPKGEHKKISSLLRDVGFNTETAFYKAFKKYTGLTPNQYKNKAKKKNGKTQHL